MGRGIRPDLDLRLRSVGRSRAALLTAVVAIVGLLTGSGIVQAAEYDAAPEDYASYQPQTKCRKAARAGTVELAEWINARFEGGTATAAVRACDSGGASEHKDGRAIDWAMDATTKRDRREVTRFLDKLFAADKDENAHAKARRMGVMYVIWNDRMWASYDGFARRDYRSSSCPSLEQCSATSRHRDHVHISLSRPGGRGLTSWYVVRD